MSGARAVWLDEADAQRFVDIALRLHQIGETEHASYLMDRSEAWDAASAKPAAAVRMWVEHLSQYGDPQDYVDSATQNILRALGMPEDAS